MTNAKKTGRWREARGFLTSAPSARATHGASPLLLAALICVRAAGAEGPAPSEETLEALSAIGYVAGVEQAAGPDGVLRHDPKAVAPGLNLMTSGHGPLALLLDMQGEVLHTWRAPLGKVFPRHPKAQGERSPPRNFWRTTRLFPNGDLLVLWEMYGMFKLDRDSNVLWALPIRAHHDLQVMPDGRIRHLEAKRRTLAAIPERPVIDDFLVERTAEGVELHRLAVSDALAEIDWLDLRAAFWERGRVRGYELARRGRSDPFHTNALQILSAAQAMRLGEPFREGDALISMAMLDTIAVVDPRSGKVRWWQQGPFGMQHQPRVTLDGTIVLFNNHYAPERSAVQVFDPRTHRVLWQYLGPDEDPLYSRRSGAVEVLENGSFLIVETDGGRVLEVTPERRIVWEYKSPYRVGPERQRVAGIYAMQRVPKALCTWLRASSPEDSPAKP